MQIRYTRHALRRMQQRKITREDVQLTLDVPDDFILGDMGETIAVRNFGSREIRVVYGIEPMWEFGGERGEEVLVIYTVMKPKVR